MEFGPQKEPIFTVAPADDVTPPSSNFVAYRISSNDGRSIVIAVPSYIAPDDIHILV